MQEHLFVSGQVIGDAGRQADAEVDVSAFGNIAGHALGHFVTGQFCMSGSSGALCGSQVFQREDALDEKCRGDDVFRVEVAQRHQLRDLYDGGFRRCRHDRAKVARRLAIDQVAQRSPR